MDKVELYTNQSFFAPPSFCFKFLFLKMIQRKSARSRTIPECTDTLVHFPFNLFSARAAFPAWQLLTRWCRCVVSCVLRCVPITCLIRSYPYHPIWWRFCTSHSTFFFPSFQFHLLHFCCQEMCSPKREKAGSCDGCWCKKEKEKKREKKRGFKS